MLFKICANDQDLDMKHKFMKAHSREAVESLGANPNFHQRARVRNGCAGRLSIWVSTRELPYPMPTGSELVEKREAHTQ